MIVWELDLQTRRFTHVSGSVAAALGYPPESWRDQPGFWIGVLHPDDRERIAHAVWQATRRAGDCEIEYRAVAVDGRVLRIRDRIRTIPDAAGRGLALRAASVAVSDPGATARGPAITAIADADRDRRRTAAPAQPVTQPEGGPELVLRARVLDALGEAVIASDVDHRIVYWNRAAERLFGWTREEAIGRIDTDLLPARPGREQTAAIIAGLVHGRPWATEVEIRTRHGVLIPVLMTVAPVRATDGMPTGVVAVVTDLRSVRASESRLRRVRVMDAIARTATGIASELDRIREKIEDATRSLLGRLPAHDPARADADDVHRAADTLASLSMELHGVGRNRQGKAAPANLNDIAMQALPLLRVICGDRITIETDLGADIAPASIDARHITQVILNIAANACAAMIGDGRLVLRTSSADVVWPARAAGGAPPGGWVVLEIRDTRETPAPEALESLFEPWADASDGLRLAVAHALVVRNEGWISAEPATGGGLLFRIYLPRSPDG